MNTTRISQAVRDIERNTAALKWLEEYGRQLDGCDASDVGISVNPHFAGSCPGAAEAAEILTSFARLGIQQLVETAITNCRNTIEIAKAAIQEEASREALADDVERVTGAMATL